MDLSKLNWLAVLAAAVSTFMLGGAWYSPALFGRAWQRESGLTNDQLKSRSMGAVFGTSFLLALIMAFNLAAFLQGPADIAWGISAGALAGIGWVAMAMGVTYLFEARSMKLFLSDSGYHAFAFMLMGGILGAWK